MSQKFLIYTITILLMYSFVGCKNDKEGVIVTYAYANVNGLVYRDDLSIPDIMIPDRPKRPMLFYGDRLGVYNDSIFVFQFMFKDVQGTPSVWLTGGLLTPKSETFPALDKTYQLTKKIEVDKYGTSSHEFIKYLHTATNKEGIAILFNYDGNLSSTSFDGTIIFKRFDRKTKKYYGDIYLDSNGKLPMPYRIEVHFSDVLVHKEVNL